VMLPGRGSSVRGCFKNPDRRDGGGGANGAAFFRADRPGGAMRERCSPSGSIPPVLAGPWRGEYDARWTQFSELREPVNEGL
jgi:hypothetical protein